MYLKSHARSRARLVWIKLALPSGHSRRFYLTDFTQVQALVEVFVAGVYDIALQPPVRRIVDLGANAGQAAVYLRDHYPDAIVLSVEADPATARVAARNLQDDAAASIVAVAVTDHTGTAVITSLADYGWSWGSNVLAVGAPRDAPTVEIPSITLDCLLTQHDLTDVDLLKVDIEGAEVTALLAGTALKRVRCVIGELHPHMSNVDDAEVLERFRVHGEFDRVRLRPDHIFVLSRDDCTSLASTRHAPRVGLSEE